VTVVVAPRLVQRRFRIGGRFRTSGGMLLCHVGTPSQAERARGIVRMPLRKLVKVHVASGAGQGPRRKYGPGLRDGSRVARQ
jgi:hypothetical protein